MAKRARRMQRNGLVTSVALIGVGVIGGLFLARWLAIKGGAVADGMIAASNTPQPAPASVN